MDEHGRRGVVALLLAAILMAIVLFGTALLGLSSRTGGPSLGAWPDWAMVVFNALLVGVAVFQIRLLIGGRKDTEEALRISRDAAAAAIKNASAAERNTEAATVAAAATQTLAAAAHAANAIHQQAMIADVRPWLRIENVRVLSDGLQWGPDGRPGAGLSFSYELVNAGKSPAIACLDLGDITIVPFGGYHNLAKYRGHVSQPGYFVMLPGERLMRNVLTGFREAALDERLQWLEANQPGATSDRFGISIIIYVGYSMTMADARFYTSGNYELRNLAAPEGEFRQGSDVPGIYILVRPDTYQHPPT